MNRYEIAHVVPWLSVVLSNNMEKRKVLCAVVNDGIRFAGGKCTLSLDWYTAIIVSIAVAERLAFQRLYPVRDGVDIEEVVLTDIQDGRFDRLETAGIFVPQAAEAHLYQAQQMPPVADDATIRLWLQETARVILVFGRG